MPIKIPNQLPATGVLRRENIFVMTETRAVTQDIRPLRIGLLNLMPKKITPKSTKRRKIKTMSITTPHLKASQTCTTTRWELGLWGLITHRQSPQTQPT